MAEAFSRLRVSVAGDGGGGPAVTPLPVLPICVTVGPVTPSLPTKPCQLYVDVRCTKPERVRFLAFRNLYAAFVTVKARVSDPASSSPPSPPSPPSQVKKGRALGIRTQGSRNWGLGCRDSGVGCRV
jgi:hypothetical protein